MRLTLFSNYLNEHQLPLCLAFRNMSDVDFTFVARKDRKGNTGRTNLNDSYDFVIRAYESETSRSEALLRACEDDVVIFGHMAEDEDFVRVRMEKGLLTFRSAERLLKRGLLWRLAPPKAWRTYRQFTRYYSKPFYALCASSYLAYDLELAGFPLEKCLSWGYFPPLPADGEVKALHDEGDRAIRLLWAARMVDWKQPCSALVAAHRLQRAGIAFRLQMVGDGDERRSIERGIARYGLEGQVEMLGTLPRERLTSLMQESDIFLFTSNRKEGWGAALGEAMACGCAVVANADAGSSPYLVDHGRNGLLYDGSQQGLDRALETLCRDIEMRERFKDAARQTMLGTWNAKQAASNLMEVIHALQQGLPNPIGSGPASPAPLFRDGWFKAGEQG